MRSRTLLSLLFALILLSLFTHAPVRAQDDAAPLRFDEPQIVSLPPDQPLARSFVVLAGDRFELRALALSPLGYSAALIDPLHRITPLSLDSAGNATLTVDPVLVSGRYTLVVQSAGAGGDLVLQLSGAPRLPDALPFNTSTTALVTLDPQRFRLEAQPDYLETLLTVTRLVIEPEPEPVTLPRVVLVDAESGEVIGVLGADALPGAALRLPGARTYLLAVEPGAIPAEIELRWEGGIPATDGGAVQLPGSQAGVTPTLTFTPFPGITGTATGTLTATLTPDPDATATPIPSPTLRDQTAPTATHTLTHTPTLVPDAEAPLATSTPTRTPTSTRTPTTTPTLAADQLPPPPLTLTPMQIPSATWTPTRTLSPTLTFTPSYTPTTPPPPPTAPPDANFNSPLNIPLDTTASVTDFVSFPGGDQQDRVRWDITGMNSNAALSGGRARLILAVSCFGTGTANISIFVGGQTYSCGQTIVDREVTFDSRTGQVTITATSGENTYVQWVLTGTATRIN